MCDIASALRNAFTPSGASGLNANFMNTQAAATDASTAAEKALSDAIAQAKAAALPVLDNPAALAANQAQMRKMMQQNGAAWSLGAGAVATPPPAATKVLFGA